MIDLHNFREFSNHFSSLQETSIDKNTDSKNGQPQPMIFSTRKAVNFDRVKEEYIKEKKLCLSEIPKSNDVLFDDGKGFLVFVEFKNGFVDYKTKLALHKKIYDSILIFSDITSIGISEMREQMKYILVYNDNKNRENNPDKELQDKLKSTVQPSSSFDAFAKNLGKYANEEYVCFGLRIFKNYCFKEVHTYTEKEFEDYLKTL